MKLILKVGFDVARTGVASVGFIGIYLCGFILIHLGFPSVGKSTLMSKLTGTHSEVAAYECILYPIFLILIIQSQLSQLSLVSCNIEEQRFKYTHFNHNLI